MKKGHWAGGSIKTQGKSNTALFVSQLPEQAPVTFMMNRDANTDGPRDRTHKRGWKA